MDEADGLSDTTHFEDQLFGCCDLLEIHVHSPVMCADPHYAAPYAFKLHRFSLSCLRLQEPLVFLVIGGLWQIRDVHCFPL